MGFTCHRTCLLHSFAMNSGDLEQPGAGPCRCGGFLGNTAQHCKCVFSSLYLVTFSFF